jgi:hypothetical protein
MTTTLWAALSDLTARSHGETVGAMRTTGERRNQPPRAMHRLTVRDKQRALHRV